MDTSKSNSILSKLDKLLAPNDFFERLCLVKTSDTMDNDIVAAGNEVAAYQLWPALKYNSYKELQEQIKDKMLRLKIAVEFRKLCRTLTNKADIDDGIAYLIGRNESQSLFVFVQKNDEGVIVEDNQSVFDFYIHAGEGYCGSAQFQAAYTLANNLMEQHLAIIDEKGLSPSPKRGVEVGEGGADTEKAESDVDESFSAQATVLQSTISPSDVEGSAALQSGVTHPSSQTETRRRTESANTLHHHLVQGIPSIVRGERENQVVLMVGQHWL
jgi:hypothetical protein